MAEITKALVMQFMCQALEHPQSHERDYNNLLARTLGLMAKASVTPAEPTGNYHNARQRLREDDPLAQHLVDSFLEFLKLGIIIPRPTTVNLPTPQWYDITEFGRQWLRQSDPVPEDPQRLLAILKNSVASLDPVIDQYLREALITYERKAYFACAVMIGAAAEKLVYLLADAIRQSAKDQTVKASFQNVMQARGLPSLFSLITKTLERLKKGALPYKVHEGATEHLLSLFETVRVQRNDAVHPEANAVTPLKVRLSLSTFPAACESAYRLIEWFSSNKF